jgi:elongator complex protein 1
MQYMCQLYLTNCSRSNTKEWLVPICQGIRRILEEKDPVQYINCILTSYVVESPPKHEEALAHLHKLKGILLRYNSSTFFNTSLATNSQIVEEAVQYIIFLVDADVLFDIALGMYDFALVLLIAQHSRRVCFIGFTIDLRIDILYLGPQGIPSIFERVKGIRAILSAIQN